MSADLERSRERLERGLAELREAVESELGALPRLGRWALAVAVAAAGFALGAAVRRRVSAARGRRRAITAGRPDRHPGSRPEPRSRG
jgi:hypothetical protein